MKMKPSPSGERQEGASVCLATRSAPLNTLAGEPAPSARVRQENERREKNTNTLSQESAAQKTTRGNGVRNGPPAPTGDGGHEKGSALF